MNLKFHDNLLPTLPIMQELPLDRVIGITSNIPIEIVFAAGYIPIDLNNIFICDRLSYKMVEDAESAGIPRNTCAWIKGIYSAAKVHEIDRLTWEENLVTGEENHIWTVSTSDMMGDYTVFNERVLRFLKLVKNRKTVQSDIRIGVIGIPPICEDLYSFLSTIGAHVVYNEIQRQFSMPYHTETLVEQYSRYTYPYDIFSRIEDIQREIKQRNIIGLIHYVQSFCHRHIYESIIRRHIRVPILTLDCDRPGRLDGAMRTRLEAFIEMLGNSETEISVTSRQYIQGGHIG